MTRDKKAEVAGANVQVKPHVYEKEVIFGNVLSLNFTYQEIVMKIFAKIDILSHTIFNKSHSGLNFMASIVLSSKEQLVTWIIGVYSQIKLKYQLKVKKEKNAVIQLMRKYQAI